LTLIKAVFESDLAIEPVSGICALIVFLLFPMSISEYWIKSPAPSAKGYSSGFIWVSEIGEVAAYQLKGNRKNSIKKIVVMKEEVL
jgi:hypothetical protein